MNGLSTLPLHTSKHIKCLVLASYQGQGLSLIDSYDCVIACDVGVTTATVLGVSPDVIIGDFDSFSLAEAKAMYPSVQIQQYPVDKAKTDLELGIELAVQKGYRHIDVIASERGRMDHYLGMFSLFERYPEVQYAFCERYAYCAVRKRACIALNPNQLISFFCIAGEVEVERSSGLKWPLDGMCLTPLYPSISNRGVDNRILRHNTKRMTNALSKNITKPITQANTKTNDANSITVCVELKRGTLIAVYEHNDNR